MNKLVFLEPNKIDAIPFTTSDVISEWAEIKHHAVQRLISKYENDSKEFGKVAFEMRASHSGQNEKIYHLNEGQATLVITYLKNTENVRAFKKELVRQFYFMRTELINRREYREQLKPIRRELTDVIQNMDADNVWAYKHYTDLAYKSATGKIAKKLREERGANKTASAIDYMTAEEIRLVAKKESQIAVLREMGMGYEQIKSLLSNTTSIISQAR